MKKQTAKLAIIAAITGSLFAVSVNADAGYRCAWRHGHKVCWHTNNSHYKYNHCYWVKGHCYHGVYYRGGKVCRR